MISSILFMLFTFFSTSDYYGKLTTKSDCNFILPENYKLVESEGNTQ